MSYQFVREPLNAEETDRLVNACRSFQGKLVVWVLLDTGLRVHEFCALRRDQVQWQENCLVVWGKGGWYSHWRCRGGASGSAVMPLRWLSC
jgi:integrase/recombinase XerD